MQDKEALSHKPRSQVIRSDLTRLPPLTPGRRALRRIVHGVSRLLTAVLTRTTVTGLDNLPPRGPALLVVNHLGDADAILWAACSPLLVEGLGKVELLDYPLLGSFLDAYGMIWVHRGHPDRSALRAVFEALKEGRMVAIAPEGRESLTGSLEAGTSGAAYIALKADVPLVPITFTGTENWRILGNIKRFRRSRTTVTVGKPFRLEPLPNFRAAVVRGTDTIMRTLAAQLPEQYRGIYRLETEE